MARRPRTIKDIDRDPDLDELLELLEKGEHVIKQISERSGVAVSTLSNWRRGKTRRPQNATIRFVLQAMGYRRRIERI